MRTLTSGVPINLVLDVACKLKRSYLTYAILAYRADPAKRDGGKLSAVVSVVMSVYNGERFLRETIESVLEQTFQDWELIVVDDASTDSTLGILAEYRDPRIRV